MKKASAVKEKLAIACGTKEGTAKGTQRAPKRLITLASHTGLTLLASLASCKKRNRDEGSVKGSSPAPISRFGPLTLLRDEERLPSLAQSANSPKETTDPKGFVISESVPLKGVRLLSSDATGSDVIERENPSGQKIKIKRFDTLENITKPEGGWWVTPIHSTLIASTGQVLLTGWGRAEQDSREQKGRPGCGTLSGVFHSGKRRYGATFLLDPNSFGIQNQDKGNPATTPSQTVLIKGVRESVNPSETFFQRQVYYCSGQVPLTDGKILYTGGSQYRNLGASGMQKEVLVYSDKGKEIRVPYDHGNPKQLDILNQNGILNSKIILEPAPEQDEVEFGVDYPKIFDPNAAFSGPSQRQSFEALTGFGYLNSLGPDVSADPSVPGFQRLNTMWYPTNTRLPGSRVLTIGGNYRWSGQRNISNRSFQVFDYNCYRSPASCKGMPAWKGLSKHDYTPEEISPGIRDYVHSFLLPKKLSISCKGNKERSYSVAVSGWPGNFYYVDTDTPISNQTAHSKTEAQNRFCKASDGQRPLAANSNSGAHGWSSSSALLSTGEILRMGGYFDPRVAQRADIFNPYASTGCSNFKELTQGRLKSCPSYRFINTGITRLSPATVLLPNGNVLIANGWADGQQFANSAKDYAQDPAMRTRIQILDPTFGFYDPKGRPSGTLLSQDFPENATYSDLSKSAEASGAVYTERPWASEGDSGPGQMEQESERGYHNFALLLKDGRVMIGGGTHDKGDVGCERPSMQIYSPPYLDDPQARPLFSATYSNITFVAGSNSQIVIKYQGTDLFASKNPKSRFGKSGVVLMAPGAFTHGFNQSQRYVGLSYTVPRPNEIHILPPIDEQVAPEGEYLLFLVSETGVPSVGLKVNVKGVSK